MKHTFVLTPFRNHYHLNTLGAMEVISDVSLLMGERNDGEWRGHMEGAMLVNTFNRRNSYEALYGYRNVSTAQRG